jgi:serine O-acetyltransferase
MNRITKADLYRYDGLTGINGFIKGMFRPGFRYTFLLRMEMKHQKLLFGRVFFKALKRLFSYRGFQIHPGAKIGEGFYLYHLGTVIIGPITIGKNCCVSHNVTIGRTNKGGVIGRPTIDDNVWIGTGAVVVGKINIGKNVLIAPNSYVNFDVPDNSIVIGNPGKIIQKDNPTKHYINYILSE